MPSITGAHHVALTVRDDGAVGRRSGHVGCLNVNRWNLRRFDFNRFGKAGFQYGEQREKN